MKKTKSFFSVAVVLIILTMGFFLRYHNFAVVPLPGESTDEYSNTWVGLSLIQLGLPVGRSGLEGYKGTDFRYINVDQIFSTTAGGNPLGINQPWLDHPPLLPLITGSYAYVSGATVFEDATARIIRKPMLVLGVFSVVLVGYLSYLIFGTGAALTTMALYATSPLMVVSSRMVQGENGVIIGFLLALIFLYKFLTKNRSLFLWLAALSAGLAILFKVSGVSVVICGLYILSTQKNKKLMEKFWESALFLVVSGSFLALYFVYGAAFSWPTFIKVWSSNSTRPYDIGFGSLFDLLTVTKITIGKRLTEGWPLMGWMSLFILMRTKSKKIFSFIVLPVFVYLSIFLLMGGNSYGWYRIPFMPFLFLAGAALLAEGFRSKDKLLPVFFILFPLGVTVHKLNEISRLSSLTPFWRLFLPVTILWFLIIRNERANRLIYLALISVAIGANILLAYSLTPGVWLKMN